MNYCKKHEIAYADAECPVCRLKVNLRHCHRIIDRVTNIRKCMDNEEIVTIEQVASAIGVKKGTVYNWNSKGGRYNDLPLQKDGKKNLTAVRSEIDAWAKKHNIKLTWRNAFKNSVST